MPEPLMAPLPPNLDLPAGYLVRVNAVDPTDGSQVTGVTVTDFSILCEDLTGGGGAGLQVGPFMLVPGPGA